MTATSNAAPQRYASTQGDRRQRPSPQHNQLLAAMPSEIQERLSPRLEAVALPQGSVLAEVGAPVHHVFFPASATVAVLCGLENGGSAAIAVVGHDGMIGISALMGSDRALHREVVVGAGDAFRLSARGFAAECEQHPEMLNLMLRYTQARMTQVALNVACLRHHSIARQLCRLLLTHLDRQWGNRLTLTHEAIAQMLGVRRESVTTAAWQLQEQEAISYRRGQITVTDRSRLEALCCECYAAARAETRRLSPPGSWAVPELTGRGIEQRRRDSADRAAPD
jgi:CRP-like cAMP-binding protein